MIKINLMKGDCLERMKEIPGKSVDMVLTDPPYGTTACKWDYVIPFDLMWEELKRISRGPILLFSKQPFTSVLNCSNLPWFKQELIWRKENHDNPMQAKNRHLNVIENISLFYEGSPKYFPQGVEAVDFKPRKKSSGKLVDHGQKPGIYKQSGTNYPKNILNFKRDKPQVHPTQKPVALLEYLVKTYTLEGETVLDFTMGSGSTGVACKNLNRNFIGIERDDKYFEIAKNRIESASSSESTAPK